MARIRSIHPGFCTSLDIAELSRDAQLHFIRLWTHCDDHGRCIDDPRLIKAACWPLDDDIDVKATEDLMRVLHATNHVVRYAVDGRSYVQIVNWAEYQKPQHPSPSKFPPPPAVSTDLPAETEPHEDLMRLTEKKVLGEGEGEGEGDIYTPHSPNSEQGTHPKPKPFAAEFEQIWQHYPRKQYRAEALSAFVARMRASPVGERAVLLADLETATRHYASAKTGTDRQHIMHGSRWFGPSQPWRDWIAGPPEGETPTARGDPLAAAIAAARTAEATA